MTMKVWISAEDVFQNCITEGINVERSMQKFGNILKERLEQRFEKFNSHYDEQDQIQFEVIATVEYEHDFIDDANIEQLIIKYDTGLDIWSRQAAEAISDTWYFDKKRWLTVRKKKAA